jgi:hypothetical protein
MSARAVVWSALVACTSPSSPAPSPPPASSTPTPTAALVGRLAAQGYAITPIDAGETLACGRRGGCVCLRELVCTGACDTLDENVRAFTDALASPDRDVACELADTGKLCDFSYFRFEGDVDRWEQRYFGPNGRLAGIRNATEEPAYCGGRARAMFTGLVPDCGQAARDVTIICSDKRHEAPVMNPTAQLELFLRGS